MATTTDAHDDPVAGTTPDPGLDEARRPIRCRILTSVDDATAIPSTSRSRRRSTATGARRRSRRRPASPSRRIVDVCLTGSHIRPQPGYGYDERRHVTVWGRARRRPTAASRLAAARAWGWDEAEVPFFEYSERSVGQSRRYFDALSAERGTPVKPRLSFGWLALRTTRLPFLSATIVPVVLGIAIAATPGLVRPADGRPHGHRRVRSSSSG